MAAQLGWNRTTVKTGDQVTVDAWLAKTRNDKPAVKSVKLSDGRELSGASAIMEIKSRPVSN
jgi:hypothetical protein